MIATRAFDPKLAACPRPWCRQPSGAWCLTAGRRLASRLHAPRVLSLAVTAHADPELRRFWPLIGPCGICGVPGLDQQHRVIDSIAGQLEAPMADLEDDPADWYDDLAAEFGVAVEAVEAVRVWAQCWPGAW